LYPDGASIVHLSFRAKSSFHPITFTRFDSALITI